MTIMSYLILDDDPFFGFLKDREKFKSIHDFFLVVLMRTRDQHIWNTSLRKFFYRIIKESIFGIQYLMIRKQLNDKMSRLIDLADILSLILTFCQIILCLVKHGSIVL